MEKIFKKSFLEGFASTDIDPISLCMALTLSLLIGIYIYLLYKNLTRKTFYSKNFNITLVGVALVTCGIIITIQSSIVVSLGMVGALSIVRFRTAIKDPLDLLFLYWSISVGIICGAGLAEFAIIISIFISVAIVVLNKTHFFVAPMILVLNCDNVDKETLIVEKLKKYAKYYKMKSKNITSTTVDYTFELRIDDGFALTKELSESEGIRSVSLLEHNGEATF